MLPDMDMGKTDILLDGLCFGEGPRWHEDQLWLSDMHAHEVLKVNADGSTEHVVSVENWPSGLGWMPNGDLLVVSMTDRRLLRYDGTDLSVHADLFELASFHCNDMLVDTQGRTWVGNFGYDLHAGQPVRSAEIILIPADGSPRIVAQDVIFPNGMAITADGNTLIVAETFAARITAFDISTDGQLSKPRLWADLNGACPDGLCLNTDGTLWLAAPNINQLLHLREGGEILGRVFPHGRPYACTLGGDNGEQLYITSSETENPEEAKTRQSGRIELMLAQAE
jgi:sugar lactone lactonase YvrE